MKSFPKNQKGFIQIPLIVIILGIVLVGGVGYTIIKQNENYQNEKREKEKLAQELEQTKQNQQPTSVEQNIPTTTKTETVVNKKDQQSATNQKVDSSSEPVKRTVSVKPASSGSWWKNPDYSSNPPSSGDFVSAPSSQVLKVMNNESLRLSYPEAYFVLNKFVATECGFNITKLITYFLSNTNEIKTSATYSPHSAEDTRQDWPDIHFEISSDVPFSTWYSKYMSIRQAQGPADASTDWMNDLKTCISDPSKPYYFFDGVRTNTVKFTAIESRPTISQISPTTGSVGTQVVITGSGFAVDSSNYVTIGDDRFSDRTARVKLLSPDGKTLSFTIPSSVGSFWVLPATIPIEVNNVRGFSNKVNFTLQ